MKQLKRINLIVGIGVICFLIASITGTFSFSTTPVALNNPAAIIFLAAGFLNLMSICIIERAGARRGLQVLGSLIFAASAVVSAILFYNVTANGQPLESHNNLFGSTLIMLSVATFLQLTAMLDTVLASTPALRPTEFMDDSDRESGSVKWFNVTKGFGFITRDEGDDIFVHYRAIRGEGHRTLSEGQRVEFIVVEKDKGLQAEDVTAAH